MNTPIPQSGVIPVRAADGEWQVLLISSRQAAGRWVIPKGWLEDGMTPGESAIAEAEEEAGVTGEIIGDALGAFTYEKYGRTFEVLVFLMRVTDEWAEWPEMFDREREWLSMADAMGRVDERELAAMIGDVSRVLGPPPKT